MICCKFRQQMNRLLNCEKCCCGMRIIIDHLQELDIQITCNQVDDFVERSAENLGELLCKFLVLRRVVSARS